ncbi:u3 small nucleolar ribonucleoprotein MPP10 [Bulinus truncatus]|nr:u3 small nucleolar ribonucleoprotein MPP10 [Bulinus truncatus]
MSSSAKTKQITSSLLMLTSQLIGEADSDLVSSEEESILKSIKERLAEESSNDKQDALDIGRDDVDSDELDFDFALNNEIATGSSDDESDKKAKKKPVNKPSEKRKTVVDDKFFKLSEMEEFLEAEDLKEAKKIKQESRKNVTEEDDNDSDDSEEGEEIDMFANKDSVAENDPMYGDFFDPPENVGSEKKKTKTKDVKQTLNEDEDEISSSESEDNDNEENGSDSSDDIEAEKTLKKKVAFKDDLLQSDEETTGEEKQKENKSTFEMKQEQLQAKAREMEELSIKEVSCELLGEDTASNRPENSLLETVLDFQHTTPSVITEETTKTLEDFIKQRIKDKTFDDVERKEKKKEEQQQEQKEVKADPECNEIEKESNKLFNQLDALSNFRYTPMKPGTEVKIIVNTPAITMEE